MPPFFIFGIILSITGILLLIAPKRMNKREVTSGAIIALFIGIGLITTSGIRIVDAGHVGIKVLFGRVQNDVLPAGLHIINPLMKVVQMSIRTEAYTMSGISDEGERSGDDSISSLTADGVSIKLDVTAWYHLDPQQAAQVYNQLGLDYVEKIVRPSVRTAIRNAVVEFRAEEIYSKKRNDATKKIEEYITSEFAGRGIVMERILVRNVILPQRISMAIDEKISALQEAQKMEFVLQKETAEAKRKEIEAQGIAKAQKIIADSLTGSYLTWYYVQSLRELARSKNNTFVITPFDQKLVPLLNMPANTPEPAKNSK